MAVPMTDPWQIDPLPLHLNAEDSPLPRLSGGVKATLNAMISRPFGVTTAKLSELSGISHRHTLHSLNDLRERGWAKAIREIDPDDGRTHVMWYLTDDPECLYALRYLKFHPVNKIDFDNDRVPQRFWSQFWSGPPADALRVSSDGVYIAATLIGGRYPNARCWALRRLPTDVLQECRSLRDFDNNEYGRAIDSELARRAQELNAAA